MLFFNKGVFGKLIIKYFPNNRPHIFSEIPITKNSSILDVGCGNGDLLFALKENGFNSIFGIDPYLKENIIYDSTAFQFLGSERYLKDIPLRDPIPNEQLFADAEIKAFQRSAIKLNDEENGDACAFILKKVNDTTR